MIINLSCVPVVKRNLLSVLLLVLFGVGLTSTNASAITYAVEWPTSSGETLPAGTVVVADGINAVRPARPDEGRYVLGAVAALTKGSLSQGTVGVASSGVVSVLVSDIGGTIKSGDRIALSSIEGVGTKSQTSGWMIGTAQADFATSPRRAVQEQVAASDGKETTVSIKEIPVLLSVTYYNPDSGTAGNGIMGSLQNTLESVVGHSVPTDRVLLALLIFGVAIILLVTLVYSAVKHSLISIGRNPLAHTKITASLVKVLLTAVAVIIVTLGIIYLILK